VFGPKLLVDSLVPRTGSFAFNNSWQYHSRSDHHSKVACWGLLFDLMRHCALLRRHVEQGFVGYGLNHEMRDFRTARKKDLDLVVCRPRSGAAPGGRTFEQQAAQLGVILSDEARAELKALPQLRELPVGAVHIALEAKACMTAFVKAKPRLYDELNSSHQAIHGNSPHTIAAALGMINLATEFISPGKNPWDLATRAPVVSKHRQPENAIAIFEKLKEVPRRASDREEGFDAFAVVMVDCHNDGTPVRLVTEPPAPQQGEVYNFEWTVHRLAQMYEQKYRDIS
jgi:hypothetical protein